MSQKDLSGLLNLNPNDPQQYQDLLSYYRSKLSEFEKERFEWLAKLEEIRIQYEDRHQQEWELIKRKSEINDLQQSMSEAKLMLFEERQVRLKLQKENDALKVNQLEDKKKIQELLAMIEPIEEQVVLQKDLRPEVTTKYTNDTLAIRDSKSGNSKMHSLGLGKSILKTVYMPNEQLNSFQLENDNLRRQLEQVELMLTQQFTALREEIKAKEVETNIRMKQDHSKLESLTKKLQKIENQNVELVKEYYNLKQKFQNKEKQLQEEIEIHKLKNQKLKMELDSGTKRLTNDSKAAVELLEKKTEEYSKKFRHQIKSKDEQLSIIKEQYSQVQNIYIDKIRQLEQNLSKLIEKYQQLEKRRLLEIEGFKNDIKRLTSRVKEQEIAQQQNQIENRNPDELQKIREEAHQVKQQLAKETGNIYSSGKKPNQQTIKATKQNVRPFSKTVKQKQIKRPNTSQQQQQQQQQQIDTSYNSEKDDQVSESVPLQELEDIQRQLDELERQMDQAKKQ